MIALTQLCHVFRQIISKDLAQVSAENSWESFVVSRHLSNKSFTIQ